MMKNSLICPLKDYTDLKTFLVDVLGLSNQFIKKSGLSKNYLAKSIRARDELEIPSDILNRNNVNYHYSGPEIDIIHEDDTCIVVDKPATVHTHPLKYSDTNNVLSFLRSRNKFAPLLVNREGHDKGLLFRLDQVTSGVLILLKDEKTWEYSRSNFNLITKDKKYIAVVHGRPKETIEVLNDYLAPMGKNNEKVRVTSDGSGNEARLEYKVMQYNSKEDLSLLEVKLVTGLRHQIRVQLAHHGHPILGDELYGGGVEERVYLHASSYHLFIGRKEYWFKSEGPELFRRLFDLDGSL